MYCGGVTFQCAAIVERFPTIIAIECFTSVDQQMPAQTGRMTKCLKNTEEINGFFSLDVWCVDQLGTYFRAQRTVMRFDNRCV